MAYQGQQQHSWDGCEEHGQTARQEWQDGKKAVCLLVIISLGCVCKLVSDHIKQSNDSSSLPASGALNSVCPSSSSNVYAGRSQLPMTETVHQALPPVLQRGQKLRYNVVLVTGRVFGFLQPLELNSFDSGGVMICEIRRVFYHQLSTRWMRFRLLGISCKRVQIETAIIKINGSNPQVFLPPLNHNNSKQTDINAYPDMLSRSSF